MSNDLTQYDRKLVTPFQMDNPVFDEREFGNMVKVAEMMASAKLVPEHLQKSPGDCLLVIEQARRWGMSPFSVAQETYSIKGRLLFGGKLITAVVNSRAPVKAPLKFDFEGEGDACVITASATLKGEEEPRTYSISIKEAKGVAGNSTLWRHDPRQQACYFAARFWARRHCPEVILGVWSEDEIEREPQMRDVTPKQRDLAAELAAQADSSDDDADSEPADARPDPAPVEPVQDSELAETDSYHDPETGEISEEPTVRLAGKRTEELPLSEATTRISDYCDAAERREAVVNVLAKNIGWLDQYAKPTLNAAMQVWEIERRELGQESLV